MRRIAIGVLFLVGPLGLHAAGAERLGTGLKQPTAQQLAWMATHFPKVHRVLPNKLAIERLNAERRAKRLPPQAVSAAAVPDVGHELIFVAAAGSLDGTLAEASSVPSAADNSTSPAFPPIGSQGDLGSCVPWATTYYQFGYETAFAWGLNAAGGDATVTRSPKWTYNMVNGGVDDGAYYSDAYDLIEKNGACTWAEFPYDTNFRAWCLSTEAWRKAIRTRPADQGTLINSDPEALIAALKTQLANGHVLVIGTYIDSWYEAKISGTPYKGEWIATCADDWDSSSHVLTLVGYDDTLWCDLNGNGVAEAGEKGAFKAVNSWGTGDWNGGFRWIAYDAVRPTSKAPKTATWPPFDRCPYGIIQDMCAYTITARGPSTPALLAEFTLTTARRGRLAVTLGIGTAPATSPSKTWTSGGLHNQGGAYAFDGTTVAVPAAFCLDFTNLSPPAGTAKRYFLGIANSSSNYPVTVSDYRLTDAAGKVLASCAQVPRAIGSATVWFYIDYGLPAPNPPVVTSATADPNPVPATTTALAATATDDAGEGSLTYTWSVVAAPTGGTVRFNANATNAAKSSVATFTRAGAYTLRVTAKNPASRTASRDLDVTVDATPTAITITPAAAKVEAGDAGQFAATALDQFGQPLAGQPAFDWQASGGGTFDPNGLFTAGDVPGGPYAVTASALGLTGTASVTVKPPNQPPVISIAYAAKNPVNAVKVTLKTVAHDTDGPSRLTYTWSLLSGPGTVAFSPNGTTSSSSTATFTAAGTYQLEVAVRDGKNVVTAAISVTVNPVPTRVRVTPSPVTVAVGGTQPFAAVATDQFGAPLDPQPAFLWSLNGGGTISPGGVFLAGAKPASSRKVTAKMITPTGHTLSGTARVSVVLP